MLAFFARVGNNSVGTVMRLACGLAIALWLSFPAAGMASRQQDSAGSANSAGQAPAAPAAPAENRRRPRRRRGKNASEGAAKEKKTDADSASGTTKRRKRAAAAPDGAPRKIVVREGGASEPAAQIAPGMTPAEAARERQNAEQLLGSTGDQLKQLAERTLDAPTAGDDGADPQLYGWCTFGVKGRRCAESKHAGREGAFAGGRFGEALEKVSGVRCQVFRKKSQGLRLRDLKPSFVAPLSM